MVVYFVRLYFFGEFEVYGFIFFAERYSFSVVDFGAELFRVFVVFLFRFVQIFILLCQDNKNGGRRKKYSFDFYDGLKVKQSFDFCDRLEVKDEVFIYKFGVEVFVLEGMWSKKIEEFRRIFLELFQDQRISLIEDYQRISLKRQDYKLGVILKKKNLVYKIQEVYVVVKFSIVKRLEGSELVERLVGFFVLELKKSFKVRFLFFAFDKGDNEMDFDFLVRRLFSFKVLFITVGKFI